MNPPVIPSAPRGAAHPPNAARNPATPQPPDGACPPSGGRPRRRGITLLEMIIALLLLSILLTLVYTSFFQISEGALRQKEVLTAQQEMRLLLTLVADDINQARYLNNFAASRKKTGIIARLESQTAGDFTRLDFHANVATRFFRQIPPEKDPGLHEVGYRVEPDGDAFSLIRREDFFLDDDMQKGGVKVKIANHIKTFLVEFLRPRMAGASVEDWAKDWNSSLLGLDQRMPRAIRLTIGMAAEQGKEWKETVEMNLPEKMKRSL
ncbi:MAG: prepilin-type N-terminal cleavage/methylation domain-containing protein [Deltaproteobacteria bacterium]|nr:prepilin-type N-terminal cleavage/methylation domain-containing protein [Deltaproteobacteria bacterium]